MHIQGVFECRYPAKEHKALSKYNNYKYNLLLRSIIMIIIIIIIRIFNNRSILHQVQLYSRGWDGLESDAKTLPKRTDIRWYDRLLYQGQT